MNRDTYLQHRMQIPDRFWEHHCEVISLGDMDDIPLNNLASATAQSPGPTNPHFLGWERYPESLPLFNGALCDAESIRRDINDHSWRLFSTEVNLKVTDVVRMLPNRRCMLAIFANVSPDGPECVAVTISLQQSNAERHITGGRPDLRIM